MLFDNTKVKRLVPGWQATIPFARGADEIIAWYDADPARQVVNPDQDRFEDELVEWATRR
jgi:ABC-type thiamine transport system substrate-binding protein